MPATLRGTRVLITGGAGFIGSNLAHRCVELGATVTIYDAHAARSGANPANLAGLEQDVSLILADIRSPDEVGRAVRGQDICVHCAAHTSHVGSMTNPLLDIDVNCVGTITLLDAARRVNPDLKIVHVATSTQVGAMRQTPIDERHAEFPHDIYSANKSASEKYVLIYAQAHGLHATVVRLANVYGPRSNIQSPDGGFVNYFIGLALRDQPIPVYGTGRQLRNLLYVEDAVEALLLAATSPGTDREVYFAVATEHAPIADIAAAIERRIGGRVVHVDWPQERQAIEVGDVMISPAKIVAALDWRPRTDLDSGLQRAREYFQPRLGSYIQERPRLAAATG